ncbi:TonB-dependent receptor [Sphingobium sp. SCG-1]|uniref:TonB-dependent receptor n=1 Tax=Sphingobium sp. SCG-1 TaxID=2072936 RepID=UPI000CD67590|nr:TonB-dependent receptor [Sphingobium sp. SCG-1]AUW58945.1 TonB-dependent receptor [Sphingobium sp. SCG-1]
MSVANFYVRRPVLLALGAAMLSVHPALAQIEPSPEAETPDGIKDIVVTARRRDETLQQTPIAITAIATAQLENKATLNIGDLQGAAPNVLITNQNSGASAANVSIRGLTFADVEKSFDPTVAVVVDGIFIGTSTGQFFDFFDIEQIEILRGPQGTLFGRNTIGGVINIRRTRPTGEFGAKLEASYGKFDTIAGRAVVNASIVPDVLAAKAFYFHNQSDGYYRNGITGKRVGESNNENYGVSFLLTPGAGFEALLTLERQQQRFDPVNSNITQTGELFCGLEPANQCNRNNRGDLYTVFNDPAVSDYDAKAVTLEMTADVGPFVITSVTGFRKSDEAQTQDFDASSSDLYYVNRLQNFRQFSHELRFAGKFSDSFDYVVGGYFYDHVYNASQDTRFFGGPAPFQITRGKSTSIAAFGDFNWEVVDRVRLSFGGRWTRDSKSNYNNVGGVQFPLVNYRGNKFTPKVGVDFRPDEHNMVYASWSRGYRSGGFSGRGQTFVSSTTPFGPETVDSYEAGYKASFFDNKVQFNFAAFYSDYSDLQQNTTIPVTQPSVGNETIVTNVGSATVKGLEADVTIRPTTGLRLTGSIGLLKSKFKNFITQEGTQVLDYSANNLIYNPKVTASVGANYKVPLGSSSDLTFDVGYRYITPYDQQISKGPFTVASNGTIVYSGNDPRVRSDRQGLLDASATIAFDLGGTKARATIYGRNLTDDRGPNAAFTVAGLFSFASAREPRAYGVTLGLEF